MTPSKQVIYVVDDDAKMRESLKWLLESANYSAETFASAEKFRQKYNPKRGGCIILDVSMPGMTGMELQEEIATWQNAAPIIFLTGHGDIPLAVRAMEAGAVGFLEKPFDANTLLERVEVALQRDREQRRSRAELSSTLECLAMLTQREREILELVVAAKSSKEIATCLDISFRTVQNHRMRILRKMDAGTTTDLVRKVTEAEGRAP